MLRIHLFSIFTTGSHCNRALRPLNREDTDKCNQSKQDTLSGLKVVQFREDSLYKCRVLPSVFCVE